MKNTQKWKRPNAQKHGIFSATAILPGEEAREFEILQANLTQEWKPTGATEEDAVLSIAKAIWRKRRLQKFIEVQIRRNTVNPKHHSYVERNGLIGLLMHVHSASAETPFVEYAPLYLRADRIQYLERKYPLKSFKSYAEWIEAIKDEVSRLLEASRPLNSQAEQIDLLLDSATFFTDDHFRQELALDERLDVMIDRAVKRLIQTKAMKQLLGQDSQPTTTNQPRIPRAPSPKEKGKR
jgi:hypothetical protein